MDIEEALKFAVDLVFEKTGVRLNKLDKIVLRGTLEGRAYKEIQETEAEARGYDVDYLSRYVAYELRKRLTEALQCEGILKPGETIRKNNLWDYLEEALKQRSRDRAVPSGQSLRNSKGERTGRPKAAESPRAKATALQDWGEALESGIFYGRTEELATLEQWIANESPASRCQLVTLIEKSTESREARFTIQPVVMKYVTDRLIERICQDLLAVMETQDAEKIIRLRERTLVEDAEQDEIKESQFRPILTGVKDRLSASLRGSGGIGEQLNELLSMLERESPTAVGYALLNIRQLAAQKADRSDRD